MPQPISPALARAEQTLHHAIEKLAPRAEAIFVREPLIDPQTPTTADLDLLVFGDVERMLFERLPGSGTQADGPPVDLIWLPVKNLHNSQAMAANGVFPHRLLSSRLVHDSPGAAGARQAAVGQAMWQAGLQAKRIAGFLELGYLTVREIGVTWDFPAMALFWVHMAYTAALAALCDGHRILCPNVYTRPMAYLRQAERASGLDLEPAFMAALHLDVDLPSLLDPLHRIQQVVSQRFPEPAWPETMRSTTRYEYRYFGSAQELKWRIAAAEEMRAHGDPLAAVFYLRFWAYSLARIPLVHQRAVEGRDVSFIRPARAMGPQLHDLCPEIVDDLAFILGRPAGITVKEVIGSLELLAAFREQVLATLECQGIDLPDVKRWQPFRPPPAP